MKLKTVTHIRTYQVSNFHFDKIGLEDSFPSDMPDVDCIKQLTDRIDAMAKVAYPHLFEQQQSFVKELIARSVNQSPYPEVTNGYEMDEKNGVVKSKPEERRAGLMESDIRSCTNIKVLETYRVVIKKHPEFQSVYDEMHEKLTAAKQSTINSNSNNKDSAGDNTDSNKKPPKKKINQQQ